MKHFLVAVAALFPVFSASAESSYSFGVLPQRSATLTAQYWNPILGHLGRKCGVTLELGTRKSALDYSGAEARGEFDFVYSNHIFAPSHAAAAYRPIARMAGKPISGQIVVAGTSPVHLLQELDGKEIGFPSKNAFVAYAAPMSVLILAGVTVKPSFGGNQEGVMAQLRAGAIPAAGVNSRVMTEYASRENFKYRALWTSGPYLDLPVAAHPRVPPAVVKAMRAALTGMAADVEGLKILQSSAAIINQEPPLGFVAAEDGEYRNQREVYRILWQKEAR